MAKENPIGVFDSGIGGTSIWREIHDLLPNENSVYLADSKNAPYGQKSKEEIIKLCIKNTNFLLEQNCKVIVVACNTATTNAIEELREKYDVPFIGIEPAIKPAAINSKKNNIGILATQGTLNSKLFIQNVERFNNTKIIEKIGHGLVTLIENGEINSEKMDKLLRNYLEPMIEAKVDYLVLGCSHYPYLIPQIKKIIPEEIKIIDSGEAVARQVKSVLIKNDILNSIENRVNCVFYTNSNPRVLQEILNFNYKIIEKDF